MQCLATLHQNELPTGELAPSWVSISVPLQDQIRAFVARAVERVPSDLRWKFWFELGKVWDVRAPNFVVICSD
jgi:hypothetical protein